MERGGFPPFQGPLPGNPVFVVWFEGQRCEVAPPEPTAAAARRPQSLLSQAAPTPPYSVANSLSRGTGLGDLGKPSSSGCSPEVAQAHQKGSSLIRRDPSVWRRSDHFP